MNANFIALERPPSGRISALKRVMASSNKDLLVWSHSLPFYRSKDSPRTLVHRVRSGKTHLKKGKFSHASVTFLCGNIGFFGKDHKQARLLRPDEITQCDTFCSFCEAKKNKPTNTWR